MEHSDGLLRYVLVLLAVVFTTVVMFFARDIILQVVVAGMLAFLLLPFARGLERWMPRWAGALIATLALFLVVMGLFFFLGWQFTRFGQDLPSLQERIAEKGVELQRWIAANTEFSRREQVKWFNEHVNSFASVGGNAAMKLFAGTGTVIASIAPIPFFIFLFLLLKDRFRTFFTKLGTTREGAVLDVMVRISELSRKYMRGVLTVTLIFGTLASLGFSLIGLKYAVLLGFVLAILNLVPYVGALVGSLLPILVAVMTKDSAWSALAALGVCLVVQFLDNNIITPKVVGSSVSINPLASLIALIGFGMLWGVAGMLLAIPITGMLKVVCDSIPSMQPWGYLLGEEIDTPEEKRFHFPFGQWRPKTDPKGPGDK